MSGNATLVNFAAGETSPRSRGRFDIPSFISSCRKLVNFICEVSGPARFRPGFKHIRETRGGAVSRLVPFQLNDSQAYMLEFSPAFMRVYKDEDLQTVERTTISTHPTNGGITNANPCVIGLVSATGLANGDEVIITGIVGMTELNGRQVKLANKVGAKFELVDPITGSNIDSTSYGTWTSGGTVVEVYEIASPYLAGELDDINFAQNRNTGYLANYIYAPRKLTKDSADTWTLATYTRTNDPFVAGAALTITSVGTGSSTCVVIFAAGTEISESVLYTFSGVVGTTQINAGTYYLQIRTPSPGQPPAGYLRTGANGTGSYVDSTAWTAYVSGGIATPAADNPIAVAFYESRLWFLGTDQRPNTIFGSMAPTDAGANRFDTFTGGIAADDACFFSLAPVSGMIDYIAWGLGTAKYLLVGTFGGPFRISGGGLDTPITPTSINVRQIDNFGCEAVAPVGGARPFYIQRGGVTLRTIRYDVGNDGYETYDMCLNAEQIGESRLTRTVVQQGRPDIVWVLREDGILCGMTIAGPENVAGWHRQKVGGTNAKVIDIAVLPRPDKSDQLWAVIERTVNGATRRSVEVLADDVVFQDPEDFYTGPLDVNANNDALNFAAAAYRRQEEYIHLDAAGTYNGSDRGSDAAATLTPSLSSVGAGVTFTASAAVFAATDVGNELWVKPNRDTGAGAGRALITAYVDTTHVTATITTAFESTAAVAAGEWHIAVETITGLWHLEGEEVSVVTDGAVYSDGRSTLNYPEVIVANGAITLTAPAAVVHVGLPYEGLLQTQNLEMGGRTGPAQAKPRNISEMFIRFLNTLGVNYGTTPYTTQAVEHRSNGFVSDRPSTVFSGIKKLPYEDSWEAEGEKRVVVSQHLPLPAVVQFIDLRYDTADE